MGVNNETKQSFKQTLSTAIGALSNISSKGLKLKGKSSGENHKQLNYYDSLTNLPNRTYTKQLLQEMLDNENVKNLTVLYLDIERFKKLNDSFGYEYGDLVIQQVAEKIACHFNHKGILSRFGSDEFVFILYPHQAKENVRQIIDDISTLFRAPLDIGSHTFYINLHAGVSYYPQDGMTANVLINHAEAALNAAKDTNRRCAFYKPELNMRNYDELILESYLYEALEKDEFELHFQPQYHSKTNKIVGVEALLRWNHPEIGYIPPDKFIPTAEQTGLIETIGLWVLRKSCEQLQKWRRKGYEELKLSVNLSLRQLVHDDFVDEVKTIIEETSIPAENLTLEITESLSMDYKRFIPILKDLKTLGLKLAIDDFGTGYSSLSYLKQLPIDFLKIDRLFIDDMMKDVKSLLIVRTIISLSEHLKLDVIAEGVETIEQLELLKESECHLLQGYFISKPVPAVEIDRLLPSLSLA
ncbi:bifunctional diguanylate cyclase/phosphodiesterase [Bacillus tianshenii]|nr:bifunctional diguanylate cyclase/phosphodiesterase [Bacillus tianshenii]